MAVTTALTGSGVAWPRGPPRLVIADEPTGIVLATHNEAVAARCDQIIHLTDGRISSTS